MGYFLHKLFNILIIFVVFFGLDYPGSVILTILLHDANQRFNHIRQITLSEHQVNVLILPKLFELFLGDCVGLDEFVGVYLDLFMFVIE